MRIIAGTLKGRKLAAFEGRDIRPTSDRTRESLFNLLMHGAYAGTSIVDQEVADLCCGTGALGLEAISRGARAATFVDQDKKSLQLARDNAVHCGVANQCHFLQADVTKLPPARTPFSLVLMDAPYGTPLLQPAFHALRSGGWLAPGTLLVSELPHTAHAPLLESAALRESRNYGKAVIHIYSYSN